jgi:DNA/RNA endonuclease G (NUC1)
MFKIIYDPRMKRANAYLLPNIDHRPNLNKTDALAYLKQFQVTVNTVEQFTGIQFLTNLSTRDRRLQVDQCAAMMFH